MSDNQITTPIPIPGGNQTITAGAASARTSAGVGEYTRFVTVSASEACHYVFGTSTVDATTSDTYLPGGDTHFVRIAPGQYVASIRAGASDSTVNVSEFAR